MNRYSIKSLFCIAAMGMLAASCADNEMINISVDEPGSMSEYDYLNDYGALKTYVDSTKYPNFKLGAGALVSDLTAGNVAARLSYANFQELTAGNCFKYGSVVADDGTMDFSNVKSFISAADNNGVSVYGHTLCWHSQQNVTYLKNIITDPNAANYILHISTPSAGSNVWDYQIFAHTSKALEVGKTYVLKMRVKASSDYNVTCWPSIENGSCQYSPTPAVSATTEWTTISSSFTANIAIDQLGFQFGTFYGDLYMDDVSLTEDGSTDNLLVNGTFDEDDLSYWTHASWIDETVTREKDESSDTESGFTEQTITDTLTYAMTNWVKGMMTACDGKVKAWDVVNEPMSDTYPDNLKSGAVEGNTKTKFYWQDYLGKDYARIPVKLAREYGPSDIKLFVNDYKLEAAYNSNAKCVGLINMINEWESDGVTKIDGIGSQMHVSYSRNADTQQSYEDAYVNMLNLLAATGKLVRISELDMGCLDTDGNTVLTDDITEEDKVGMAEYYKFIVEKYLELIPAAQQYGICQWSPVDSPSSSSWRGGEPIGLWDLNYSRKPAYGGFADGLAGK